MAPRMATLGVLVGLGRVIHYRPYYFALRRMSLLDLLTEPSLIMIFIPPLLSITSLALIICCMLMTSLFFARQVDRMPAASNAFLIVTPVYLGRRSIRISQRRTLASTFLFRIEAIFGTL
ncbi:hypothetical protein ACS0TY_007053 [Phlomoides rotata]